MHTHPTRTWKLRGISSFTTYLSPSGSAWSSLHKKPLWFTDP
jgi:hypothetical protein